MASGKYLQFYRERIPNLAPHNEKGESVNVCIFHADKAPSLAVNVDSGLWKCYTPTCAGARGGGYKQFDKLLKGEVPGATTHVEPIEEAAIDGFHELLLRSTEPMEMLTKKRGLTLETIKKHKLGWDADRVLIPVRGPDGKSWVNVRKYKYGATEDKMIAWGPRYNRARLYPVENIAGETVILTEGELDALTLDQMGFPAATSTGGADAWFSEFNEMLRNKNVYLCYDADKSGKAGARQVAVKLLPYARTVHIVHLPLAGTKEEKDVTDFIVKMKRTKEDFQALLDKAELIEDLGKGNEPDAEVHDIHLSRIGDKTLVGKRVRSTVLVAGKDLAPYQVPWKTHYMCPAVGSEKACERCVLGQKGGQNVVEFKEYSPELLEFVNVSKGAVSAILERTGGIPDRCAKPKIEVLEYANIETVKFIPELDFAASDTEYVIRSMFYLGERMETNHTYRIEGIVQPEPKTQYATALIYKADKAQSSIEKFELTPEVRNLLQLFKVT